ncbi:hypothetical protein ACOSQ2_003652 [Xanthoceras sorbifolium]
MTMTAAPNIAVDVGLLSLIRDVRLDRALFQPYKKKKNGSLAFHRERAPVNIEHNMATQQQQRMQVQEGRGASANARQLVFMIGKSFNCLIPMLIGVLQVNSQSKYVSPFETHPTNMWVFMVSTFIYFCAAQRSIPLAVISGSLSSVSIVSVLLPPRLGPIIFIPWTFVPIIVAYQVHAVSIRNACQKLNRMMIDIISKLSATCTSIEQ